MPRLSRSDQIMQILRKHNPHLSQTQLRYVVNYHIKNEPYPTGMAPPTITVPNTKKVKELFGQQMPAAKRRAKGRR